MRRLIIQTILALMVSGVIVNVCGQARPFTSDGVEYALELPGATWRVVAEPDSVHQHAEFVYGDRNDGYLRVRKEVVDAGASVSDVARRESDQKLRFLPGYVEGREENFAGRLSGIVTSYEYTSGGKPMVGRIYYLRADNRTVYALRFTGLRGKLAQIRNQTDAIARSFRLK
ncbi:MAG: hypothetical protein ABR577_00490 [Pyrinomonadaceae bacterium]